MVMKKKIEEKRSEKKVTAETTRRKECMFINFPFFKGSITGSIAVENKIPIFISQRRNDIFVVDNIGIIKYNDSKYLFFKFLDFIDFFLFIFVMSLIINLYINNFKIRYSNFYNYTTYTL
jgi:hypothetical protein